MSRSRVYLAAMGDVNDANTWSGIPYHFLQAAKAGGLIDEGLRLECEGPAWQRARLLWNGWRWITGRGRGGYQYSVNFLERLWQPVAEKLVDQAVKVGARALVGGTFIRNARLGPWVVINEP